VLLTSRLLSHVLAMIETMDDDADAAAASATSASEHGPAVDGDAIVASQETSRFHQRKRRRRRLTAAERFSRWMDDTNACFLSADRTDDEGPTRSGDGRRMARDLLDLKLSSLPLLLAHREAYGGLRSRAVGWQRHVLARPEVRPCRKRSSTKTAAAAAGASQGKGTMNESHSSAGTGPSSAQPMRYEFRHWLRRTVPFTRLGTPRSEAVLGLDQTGSYSITLGDLDVPGADADCDHHDGGTYDRSGGRNHSRACLALRMYGTWVELARNPKLDFS
jgi:hypothetical protein